MREYYFRLGVVAIAVCIALVGAAGVLLLPTYVYLVGSAAEKAGRLAHIQAALSSADEKNLSARLASLSHDATALIALSKKSSVSGAMRSVLEVPRPGITLSSITFTPGTAANTVLVTGTAVSRDALRGYQMALQDAPVILTATLPVSVYAKDTNITFTITLTLAP
jgi:hypothetical protein